MARLTLRAAADHFGLSTKTLRRRIKSGAVHAAAVALVVAFLLLPTVSRAAEDPYQGALRGLKGVHVIVPALKPQTERLGLSKDQILTDVELRLRKSGVRVLTEKESLETPGMPFLYVNVGTFFREDHPLVAYSIDVALVEWVTLARGFKTGGAIWEKGSVGSVGMKEIRGIRQYVGDMVDKFINDYLAANPK